MIGGPRVWDSRNRIVEAFLEEDSDYLWMVDTDMQFPPDTPIRLLECDKDIVGGLCFDFATATGNPRPVLSHYRSGKLVRYLDYPKDRLVKVDATGAACILISRDVLVKVSDQYDGKVFAETVVGGVEHGEDVSFCLRADEAGFETFVHTGIRVGHCKTVVI